VPLSEHEQQLLDQIESALYAEDPKFASNVRGKKLRRPSRRRRIQGIALSVIGLGLLLGGLLIPWQVVGIPIVSVIGFPVMFVGVVLTLTSLHGDDDQPEGSGDAKSAAGAGKAARSSFSRRMEDRLRKRFDQQ
jgi:hypothetical protein